MFRPNSPSPPRGTTSRRGWLEAGSAWCTDIGALALPTPRTRGAAMTTQDSVGCRTQRLGRQHGSRPAGTADEAARWPRNPVTPPDWEAGGRAGPIGACQAAGRAVSTGVISPVFPRELYHTSRVSGIEDMRKPRQFFKMQRLRPPAGSTPACRRTSAARCPREAAAALERVPSILRRWENSERTIVSNRRRSGDVDLRRPEVQADDAGPDLAAAGRNAPGGSVSIGSTSASSCTMIDSAPYCLVPGGDATRSATSRCSISVASRSLPLDRREFEQAEQDGRRHVVGQVADDAPARVRRTAFEQRLGRHVQEIALDDAGVRGQAAAKSAAPGRGRSRRPSARPRRRPGPP